MKLKHIQIRIEQCLALSKASNCPRRQFGALLLDPTRNVILMDGYNGAPRDGGKLCGGSFCERDGLKPEDVRVVEGTMPHYHSASVPASIVQVKGENVKAYPAMHDDLFDAVGDGRPESMTSKEQAEQFMVDLLASYPGVASGTHMEIGCHHAEMNVVCNAAASGVKTKGAWLIVTGEPCRMCAKLIHHAGIERVIVVKNGYAGANGVQYLEAHGVRVQAVDGPSDPRLTA